MNSILSLINGNSFRQSYYLSYNSDDHCYSLCHGPCSEPYFTSLSFNCSPPCLPWMTLLCILPFVALESTVLEIESDFILKTCPIHLYLSVFTCTLNLSDLVLFLISSFVTFIGQRIFSISAWRFQVCPHTFSSCTSWFRCVIRSLLESLNISHSWLFFFAFIL